MGLEGVSFHCPAVASHYFPLSAAGAPTDDALHIYFNFNAIQGVSDPLTPLGMDALRLAFSGVIHTFGVKPLVTS